jgi:hypothetical protein
MAEFAQALRQPSDKSTERGRAVGASGSSVQSTSMRASSSRLSSTSKSRTRVGKRAAVAVSPVLLVAGAVGLALLGALVVFLALG